MATIPLEFPSADLYYDLAKKTLFYVSCERQVFCVHVEEDNLRFPSLVREDSGEQGAPCEPLKVTSSRLRGYSDILSIEGSSENNVLFVGSTSGHIFQVDQNSGDTVCEWAVENKVDAAVVLKPWNNLV